MDKREYLRVVQVGTARELMHALRDVTDFRLTLPMVDRKIAARNATKHVEKSGKKPRFFFGPKFFTKLNMMPAVSIEVRESRSQIRKTCYGFRDRTTGERVYLRIDPGSVVEFRDSTCGYLIGTRYLIPGLSRMRPPRWDKVDRKMRRLLSAEGIIVDAALVRKYRRSTYPRVKLAKKIVERRIAYAYLLEWHRRRREKAVKQVS